jgi:L-alanine-DL-glutamate epimerase-like enolase superfamily enzyme
VALYDSVRDLPLVVEAYDLDGHAYDARADFRRKTTVIRLAGAGEEGLGEDVTYDGDLQDAQQARGAVLPLAGEWTIESFSRHLGTVALFPEAPDRHDYEDYRRWAFESAALDLALRQAGRSLGGVVRREPRPVTFVASGGLGDPPSTARLRAFLALYPTLRFKLDARPDWTDAVFDELRELGCVDSIDLKGQYSGTVVDNPPDPALYRRVLEAFPEAWIEDPALTDDTLPVLEPEAERLTWDAPIHAVADIEALRWPPRTVNVKPSRFGSIERLLAAYDYCESHGIGAYGGGQWELSVGRGHIQLLAALFHPDTPNDVAPRGYNAAEPPVGLPESPLTVEARATGFHALT